MMPTKEKQIAVIAEAFGLPCIEIQFSDPLDTYEVAVWKIKAALDSAYEAGYQAAATATSRRRKADVSQAATRVRGRQAPPDVAELFERGRKIIGEGDAK